jgi:hypothetical protein
MSYQKDYFEFGYSFLLILKIYYQYIFYISIEEFDFILNKIISVSSKNKSN